MILKRLLARLADGKIEPHTSNDLDLHDVATGRSQIPHFIRAYTTEPDIDRSIDLHFYCIVERHR